MEIGMLLNVSSGTKPSLSTTIHGKLNATVAVAIFSREVLSDRLSRNPIGISRPIPVNGIVSGVRRLDSVKFLVIRCVEFPIE